MKASCCGCPDGAPSDGDGTTLARAAARFREQQPNSTSMFEAQAQRHPTTNIIPTKKREFGAGGSTLSGAADSAQGLYNLCGAEPGATRGSSTDAVNFKYTALSPEQERARRATIANPRSEAAAKIRITA